MSFQEVFVMPSSSARCSQLPRAIDKVPFYLALKKYRDYLRGQIPVIDLTEITFPDLKLETAPKKEVDETKPVIKKEKKETKPAVKDLPGGPEKKKRVRKTKKQREQEAAEKLNCDTNVGQCNTNVGESQPPDYSQGMGENPGQTQQSPFSQGQRLNTEPHISQCQTQNVQPSFPQGQTQSTGSTIWNPINQGMWQPATSNHPDNSQAGAQAPNMNNVFQNTSLVKQEDTSDLAEYGITANTFRGFGTANMYNQQWGGSAPYMQNAGPYPYPPHTAYPQGSNQLPFGHNGQANSQPFPAPQCPTTSQTYFPPYGQPANMGLGQGGTSNTGGQQPPGQNL